MELVCFEWYVHVMDDCSCNLNCGHTHVCLHEYILSTVMLSFSNCNQVGTCFVSQSGIKMTVEDAKCVQANAFIQATMFRQYTYQGDAPISFQINLAALIVCLHVSMDAIIVHMHV